MNLFDKILPRKKLIIQSSTGGELLKVDATISENHKRKSKATKHPIEDGSRINDHIIIDNRIFDIEGVISDTPITLSTSIIGGAASTLGNVVDGPLSPIITGAAAKLVNTLIGSEDKPSKTAKEILEFIQVDAIPTVIITGLDTYINMFIVDLEFPRDNTTTNILRFKATFEQLRIVSSEVAQVPAEFITNPEIADQASEKKNLGRQVTDAVSDKVTEKGSSVLFKLKGLI